MAKGPGIPTPKEGKANLAMDAKPELWMASNAFVPRSVLRQNKKKDQNKQGQSDSQSPEPRKSPSSASEYSDIFRPFEHLTTLTLNEERDHVTPEPDMNRQRTGRSTAVRGDGNKDTGDFDIEAQKNLVREGLLEAQKHNNRSRELGLEIVALEEEIKSKGKSK